jgi:hypothetical protein
VGGDCVGYGGVRSPFWKIYQQLAKAEDEDLPERLLASDHPVTRAMGLALLVARDGEKAAPALTERISDRGPLDLQPYGCIITPTSVGAVARGLLANRNFIAHFVDRDPLLDEEALLRLDMEILARDDTALIHDCARGIVEPLVRTGALPLDLAVLGSRFPGLSPERIVKALGRVRHRMPREALEDWLRSLLRDEKSAGSVRLAAASALTRRTRPESTDASRRALEDAREFLREHEAEGILEDFEAVRELADAGEEAEAFAEGHAAAIPILEGRAFKAYRWDAKQRDLAEASLGALRRAAERASQRNRHWDTWGEAPYRLEAILLNFGKPLAHQLGEKLSSEFREYVRQGVMR